MAKLNGTFWAINISPVFLRVVLGITFIWYALGAMLATVPVQGQAAATLANMGLVDKPAAPKPPIDAPQTPLPKSDQSLAEPARQTRESAIGFGWLALAQAETASSSVPAPRPSVAAPTRVYTAEEFSDPVPARRMWMTAMRIHDGAHADGTTIWPKALAGGLWPKGLAMLVVGIELLCGFGALVGLLTRTSGFLLGCLMLGAVWLDQIGPAIQSGATTIGFLPAHGVWDTAAWRPLMWQLALMSMGFALACVGSGVLSVDRLIRAIRLAPKSPAAGGGSPAGGGGGSGGPRRA